MQSSEQKSKLKDEKKNIKEIPNEYHSRISKCLEYFTDTTEESTDNFKDRVLYAEDFFYNYEYEVDHTSIFYIHFLLSATPRRKLKDIKEKFTVYIDTTIGHFTGSAMNFHTQVLFSMVLFINASIYVYRKLSEKKELQSMFFNFFVVLASNLYEELYSTRGKQEFAYYFKKLLQNNQDLQKPITPYNTNSWRKEFGELTKYAKIGIDNMLNGRNLVTYIIAGTNNLYLTIGKIADKRLKMQGKRYIVDLTQVDIGKKNRNRIFIVTIKQ